MPREMKFTRQEVARIIAAMSRSNYALAREIGSPRLKDSFRNRGDALATAATTFLNDSEPDYSRPSARAGWKLWAPDEIRVRASRRARTYFRRRPRRGPSLDEVLRG